MNKALILPMLLTMTVAGMAQETAKASELRMTVEKPHFTCEGRGQLLSHVDYVPGQDPRKAVDEAPLPCCDGQIGCAQFLSTNTILHADHPTRS